MSKDSFEDLKSIFKDEKSWKKSKKIEYESFRIIFEQCEFSFPFEFFHWLSDALKADMKSTQSDEKLVLKAES